MWTYFQPQFYLPVYVHVNHATVLHKRFRRCPRAPGSTELREGEYENKTERKSSPPTFTCLLLSSSPLSQILALSLPAWEIYDVLVPLPRSYTPHSPHSRSFLFSKRKRKPCRCTGYEFYTKNQVQSTYQTLFHRKRRIPRVIINLKATLKRHNSIHLFFDQACSKFIIHTLETMKRRQESGIGISFIDSQNTGKIHE